jgi:regulator of extracellular matrix RemA (YlzA/DUF370 family)
MSSSLPVLINIGFGNVVQASRIIAVLSPSGVPMKRLREEARDQGKLIDATAGRRTRSIIISDSGHVILSSQHAETISQRFTKRERQDGNEKG